MAKRGRKPKPPPLGLNGLGADDQRRVADFVRRIERLEAERADLVAPYDADIAQIYADARRLNFDARTIRALVRERAIDATKRQQREDLLDSYRHALGMLADTPLGRAALERDGAPVKPQRRKRRATGEADTQAAAGSEPRPGPDNSGDGHVGAESTGTSTPDVPAPFLDCDAAGETVSAMRALRGTASADGEDERQS